MTLKHRLVRAARFAVCAAVLLGLPAAARAQTAQDTARLRAQAQQLTPMQREVLRRLRESRLSREQIRERLRQAGYDPNLADRYLEALAADTSRAAAPGAGLTRLAQPLPQPSGDLLQALGRIGILAAGDSLPAALPEADTLRRRPVPPRERRPLEPQVFGKELFSATTTQFQVIPGGPVDPGYRLGPGDQLTLILTGDVELAYNLEVTREGFIIVPDIGRVDANGLTLDELRNRLNARLGRAYSSVQLGTTSVDLSVGRLRSILVYIIGDVELPGGYQISGASTVFNALYQAGGPTESGSFRRIEVRRGNRVVQTVDLYDYLLRGDKSGDIRLAQGDIVFVPVVGRQVTVTGSVRRPAIFELRENEDLDEVLRFAGGVEANAALDRIQIDRIQPPELRQPGRERVLVDVPLRGAQPARDVPLVDGDRVTVSAISEERRNRVVVRGDVHRPGEFEFRPGMTAAELVAAAQGLLSTAYTPNAHIVRLNRADSTTSIVRVNLDNPAALNHASRVPLADLDELVVFGRAQLTNPAQVEIYGYVKEEGAYPYAAGMSVEDLLLSAGGFREGAHTAEAEVSRRVAAGDTVARLFRVPLSPALAGGTGSAAGTSFELQPGDQVFIRRATGYEPLAMVDVSGEVRYPGLYTVASQTEHITEVIRRAGGLTPEAYARGFRLFRDGKPVAVDLPRALQNPRGQHDLVVEKGDRLEIPRYDPTVLVTGAVQFESRIRYEPGMDVDEYLERAGGVRTDGSRSRTSVRYPNGEVRTSTRILGVRRWPRVEPGSTITVPVRPETQGTNWDQVLSRTLTVLSTLATLLVAYNTIK